MLAWLRRASCLESRNIKCKLSIRAISQYRPLTHKSMGIEGEQVCICRGPEGFCFHRVRTTPQCGPHVEEITLSSFLPIGVASATPLLNLVAVDAEVLLLGGAMHGGNSVKSSPQSYPSRKIRLTIVLARLLINEITGTNPGYFRTLIYCYCYM